MTVLAHTDHDAVVVGGGVGGLAAAAELVLAGRRPLLLEQSDRLGGRFSTIEKDGYRLPTGAVAIETAGPFYEMFGRLGIDADLRVPDPPVMIHVRGRNLQPGAAVWKHMMKRVTKAAGAVAEGLSKARSGSDEGSETLEHWVLQYTKSKTLLSLFQSLAASIFTVNADELPASAFFRLLRETGGYKSFGYAPRGNRELADAIGEAIVERGGEVRLSTCVEAVRMAEGQADAVLARGPGGQAEWLPTRAVISNAGPRATARLFAETPAADDFARRVSDVAPSSMLALAFSTQEPVVEPPGIWAFTDTQRMCNLANLTATCPELAPEGRSLYEAYSVPRPSVGGNFDVEQERKLLEQDLLKFVPGFAGAETVLFKVMRGDVPAQQCRPGYDPDIVTPVGNVLDVGDGVKPYGWIGTTACAETARRAVEQLLSGALASPSGVERVVA
ncbi:MAG: FAD-dependent oxidoreductase [Solirubrobacteraceae bacterium]